MVEDLAAARDGERLRRLGFRDADAADATAALAALDADDLAVVGARAEALRRRIGDHRGESPFRPEDAEHRLGQGIVPLAALLATVDDVRAHHRSRGVPSDVSWQTLADLGQQVWVHRTTFGGFGLHTHHWLATAWSGGLFWLGRLQFHLTAGGEGLVLDVHIPESGPLTPDAVDDAMRQARGFFARHFADRPAGDFTCHSWLLDPQLQQAVPGSNIAAFQARWLLTEEIRPGDADAVFFVFRRRGGPDLATLPRDTRLQRAIVDHLRSGGHWHVRSGTTPGPAADHERLDAQEN